MERVNIVTYYAVYKVIIIIILIIIMFMITFIPINFKLHLIFSGYNAYTQNCATFPLPLSVLGERLSGPL